MLIAVGDVPEEWVVARTSSVLRLSHEFPDRALRYPQIRFMGSKFRLPPWLHNVSSELDFDTALDAFSGSGCVSYLLKCMGKEVHANDFLNFCTALGPTLTRFEYLRQPRR